MNKKHLWFSLLGSGGVTTNPQTAAQERFGTDLIYGIEPHLTKYMRKEPLTSVALTVPTLEDDKVGTIQDVAYGAILQATGAGVEPKLGLATGRNAAIKFDGVNDWLVDANSLGRHRGFWSSNPVGSIMFSLKVNADGSLMVAFNSQSGTGGQTGLYGARLVNNKVRIWITKAGPNVTVLDYNSTATHTVADGWKHYVVDLNGAGAGNASVYIDETLDGTATITAGTDSQNASQAFRLGTQNDNSNDLNGSIGHTFFLNRVSTAEDRAWFQTYDPAVDADFAPYISHTIYDFSDTTKMFTERTSPATNVVSNNDPIGTIQNQVGYTFGTLNRDATAPSDAKRPLYKTSAQNGLSAAYYDGDVSFQELNFAQWAKGGVYTFVIASRFMNDDPVPPGAGADEGRKILSDGAANATTGNIYLTITAEDDSSNTPALAGFGTVDGDPYIVAHPGGAADGIKASGRNDTINIAIVVRDGATVTFYNMDGEKTTFTSTGSFNYQKMGGIAGTWTNNNNFEFRVYSGIIGGSASAQDAAAATLMATLKTKWGV